MFWCSTAQKSGKLSEHLSNERISKRSLTFSIIFIFKYLGTLTLSRKKMGFSLIRKYRCLDQTFATWQVFAKIWSLVLAGQQRPMFFQILLLRHGWLCNKVGTQSCHVGL